MFKQGPIRFVQSTVYFILLILPVFASTESGYSKVIDVFFVFCDSICRYTPGQIK